MQAFAADVHRLSTGGFDPNGSARENVERYNTYRRTSGGGGGGNGGDGKGGFALVLMIAIVLLAFLNMCVSNR